MLYRKKLTTVYHLLLLTVAMVCVATSSIAQKQQRSLDTVNVKAKRNTTSDIRLNDFATGQKIQTVSTKTMQLYNLQSVGTLLSQQLPVFVKSYSFNGLATISFRGASAAQSQVLWNGIPIQNAALGVADVSALPVPMINKISIAHGGSGALLGSGNVGGALLLDNEQPEFDRKDYKLSACIGSGSYGQYNGSIKSTLTNNKWYVSVNTFAQAAKNNYQYTNTTGAKQTMNNGKLESYSAMLNAAYQIKPNNTIGVSVWTQQYQREIPPALFEAASVKKQEDQSVKLLADWQMIHTKYTLYAKSSFIVDKIDYNDAAVNLQTNNTVHQYYQETGWKQHMGKAGQLLLFVPVQRAWLPNGNDTQYQNRVALAGAWSVKLLKNKLGIAVQSRAEVINNKQIFLPGAGATYAITDKWQLRANAQRSYRVPTLNELYYFPGGNPRLRPEQGWSQDVGHTLKASKSKFRFYHDASLFNRNINDWIMWLGGAVWTPHNIARVHSRGTETENRITYTTGKWTLNTDVYTSYILATTTESYILNDGSMGKQIPYTPRYNYRMNIGASYSGFYLNYNHSYTGYRFITTDESSWLTPYQCGNIQLLYTKPFRGRILQLSAQVNNVWNEQYSVAGYRPMPGTNWLLGIVAHL